MADITKDDMIKLFGKASLKVAKFVEYFKNYTNKILDVYKSD